MRRFARVVDGHTWATHRSLFDPEQVSRAERAVAVALGASDVGQDVARFGSVLDVQIVSSARPKSAAHPSADIAACSTHAGHMLVLRVLRTWVRAYVPARHSHARVDRVRAGLDLRVAAST